MNASRPPTSKACSSSPSVAVFRRAFFAALLLPTLSSPAAAGGFLEPVAVLPEVGLWADAFTELGYGRDPGIVVVWGLDPRTATGSGRISEIAWSDIAFRIRVELFHADGRRVTAEDRIVDRPHMVDGVLQGGFPATLHHTLREPGAYRARLEAYALMDASAAGLDSVPRRAVEVETVLEGESPTGDDWRVSDLLLLRDLQTWRPGASRDRSWYEWLLDPAVSRQVDADSAGAFLAFEIQRGQELVPRCRRTNCRVAVTIYDGEGGLMEQTLRAVPQPFSVSAYVVPIQTASLEPGEYEARVEVYEANQLLAWQARRFRVRPPAGVESGEAAAPEGPTNPGSP